MLCVILFYALLLRSKGPKLVEIFLLLLLLASNALKLIQFRLDYKNNVSLVILVVRGQCLE